MATPEAVAWIAVQKYVMYSPLYRQEQELRRMGVQLSRQTMSKWLTLACKEYLKPIYELLKKRVQAADICHADETPLQVLNEPNRSPQQKSYMWLFRTGKYAEIRPLCMSTTKRARPSIQRPSSGTSRDMCIPTATPDTMTFPKA
jgi:hypothetical protein